MIKRMIIYMASTLLLVELYSIRLPWIGQLFPEKVYLHFYPLSPGSDEAVQWYVSDIVGRIIWVGSMVCWILSLGMQKQDQQQLKPLLVMLTIYRGMDLVIYLLNHSHAGSFYGIVYIPILGYAAYITFKRKFWQAAEWLYSKIRKDGSSSR